MFDNRPAFDRSAIAARDRMISRRHVLIGGLGGVGALAIAGPTLLTSTPAFAAPQAGQAAPAFSIADTKGATQSLAALKGKVVVLEWTNADCPFVRKHYGASVAEREAFLKDMRVALGVPMSLTLDEELKLPMTWEHILEMDRSGLVTFGAHTVHHPVLACLKDPAEVQREVRECREVLEERLDHPVRAFAYTMGKPGDIDMQTLQAVKDAGYSWAFTTVSGVNTPRCNPYQLLRMHVDSDHDWLFVATLVSGIWLFISPLWKKAAFSLRRSQE